MERICEKISGEEIIPAALTLFSLLFSYFSLH